MAKPSLTRLPRDQKETRAGEDCGLLECDGGRAQLRLRVGRFFSGDTPKSSVILGNLKTVSDGAAVICCRGYPVHYYLQSRQQLWLKAEPNRTNLAWCRSFHSARLQQDIFANHFQVHGQFAFSVSPSFTFSHVFSQA